MSIKEQYRYMNIICPFCPTEPMEISPRDEATVCPLCERRYRIETFRLLGGSGETTDYGRRYSLDVRSPGGQEKTLHIKTTEQILWQNGTVYTLVERSGVSIGIANQDKKTWIYLQPPTERWPKLNKWAIAMSGPIVFLAFVQIIRAGGKLDNLSPVALLVIVTILLLATALPLLFWILERFSPTSERGKLIKGYQPEKDTIDF